MRNYEAVGVLIPALATAIVIPAVKETSDQRMVAEGELVYLVIPDEELNAVDVAAFKVDEGLLGHNVLVRVKTDYRSLVKVAGGDIVYRVTNVSATHARLRLEYYYVRENVLYCAKRTVTAKIVTGVPVNGSAAINAPLAHFGW